MTIYQLFEEKNENFHQSIPSQETDLEESKKGHLLSTLVTRFCFLLLFIADSAWFFYNIGMISVALALYLLTGGRVSFFKKMLMRSFFQLRRSIVCGLSLLIGLFSPPFGIMVACTYFLMYDKAGMEEVVPAPLQAQFKTIFNKAP